MFFVHVGWVSDGGVFVVIITIVFDDGFDSFVGGGTGEIEIEDG